MECMSLNVFFLNSIQRKYSVQCIQQVLYWIKEYYILTAFTHFLGVYSYFSVHVEKILPTENRAYFWKHLVSEIAEICVFTSFVVSIIAATFTCMKERVAKDIYIVEMPSCSR